MLHFFGRQTLINSAAVLLCIDLEKVKLNSFFRPMLTALFAMLGNPKVDCAQLLLTESSALL